MLVLNLGAMAYLTRAFAGVARRAAADDTGAQATLFAIVVAMMVLAPAGATLKRWHYHARRVAEGGAGPPDGCLFSPVFYFCLTAVVFSAAISFVLQNVYGRGEPAAAVFVLSVFGGLALMVAHTVLVYRYFSPPRAEPKSAFLRDRASGLLGDLCLFANMVLFQLVWNLLGSVSLPKPTGLADFVLRLGLLAFLALLLYFPPRMFYLAEDIGKPRTWVMILLANAPVIARLLLGGGEGAHW